MLQPPDPAKLPKPDSVAPTEHPLGAVGELSEAPVRFTQDLHRLLKEFEGRDVTLGELASSMRGRGAAMLAILLAAPFIQPLVPLPGLETPMGIGIAMASLRLSTNERPWLPDYVYRRSLSPKTFQIVIKVTLFIAGWIEKSTRPRFDFMFGPRINPIHGYALSCAGALMAVPLFIPGTHTPRAIPVLFLAGGWMERDGLWLILGYLFLAGSLVFTVVMAYELVEKTIVLIHWMRHHWM